jgi:hypothetical protein
MVHDSPIFIPTAKGRFCQSFVAFLHGVAMELMQMGERAGGTT